MFGIFGSKKARRNHAHLKGVKPVYTEKKETSTPGKSRSTGRRAWRMKLRFSYLHILGLVGLIGFVGVLYAYNTTRIQEIRIQRSDTRISQELVGAFLTEELSGKSMILMNSANISESLREAFPEVDSVVVQKQYPGSLIITITSVEPAYLWRCRSNPQGETILGALLTQRGQVLELWDGTTVYPEMRTIDEIGVCPETVRRRDEILLPSILTALESGSGKLESLFQERMSIALYYRYAREVSYQMESGKLVRTDLALEMGSQIDTLAALLVSDARLRNGTQVYDVRVPEKVYLTPQ